MTIGLALIRGINVGGKNLIKMDALRGMFEELGLKDPRTYIQSGNVVFRGTDRAVAKAAAGVEAAIEAACGFRPGVVVRTLAEARAIVAADPFAGLDHNPSHLIVMFLAGTPDAGAAKAIAGLRKEREEVRIAGREVFISFPDGIGTSKLSLASVERALKTPGTSRNWTTVLKLVEMGGELEASA